MQTGSAPSPSLSDQKMSATVVVISDPSKSPKGFWLFSYRFLVVLLLCFGLFVAGLMRISVGMAMVCMVNGTALRMQHENSTGEGAARNWANQSIVNETATRVKLHEHCGPKSRGLQAQYDGALMWDTKIQGMIFAAFFYGSVLSSIPAGWLSDRFGPKIIYLVSIFIYMAGSMLTPVAANAGFYYVIAIRAIMGIAEGMIQPCIAATLARWIPPDERSTAIAIYTAGAQLCMVAGMPLFAFLCSTKQFWGGWPSIYYLAGVSAVPWCILWLLLVTNKPDTNKHLSDVEREHIRTALSTQNLRRREGTKLPWRGMLTSMPVWACNISNFGSSFAVFTLQAYLPTYYKQVLNLDLKQNGFYSSLPFLVKWVVKMTFGFVADFVKKKTSFSRTTLCKIFNSIGCFGCGLFFVACSFLDCSQRLLALLFLCFATGLSSGYVPGALTSAASIAPHYSGSVRSWTGLFNQLAGLVAPYIVSAITVHGTREEWQLVFFTVAGILTVAGIFFCIFGSAEIQPWAKTQEIELQLVAKAVDSRNGHDAAAAKLGASNGAMPECTFALLPAEGEDVPAESNGPSAVQNGNYRHTGTDTDARERTTKVVHF